MQKLAKRLSIVMVALFTLTTLLSYAPAKAATVAKPQAKIVQQPNATYTAGDILNMKLQAPNYKGKVEYKVVIENLTTKNVVNLFGSDNLGYYTKSQPSGLYAFPIHWGFNDAGSYRVFVYVRPANTKIALSSYVVSNSFTVAPKVNYVANAEAKVTAYEKVLLDTPDQIAAAAAVRSAAVEAVGQVTDATAKAGFEARIALVDKKVADAKGLSDMSVSAIATTLNNPISSTYPDMVFLGTPAQIFAKVVNKEGNPVANVPVLFEATAYVGEMADFVEPIAYTNSEGIAVGFLKAPAGTKITEDARTIAYKASVVGKNVTPAEGKVRFASLSVGTAEVTAPVDEDGNVALNPRQGAAASYVNPMITSNMNGDFTQYVASEKVSATGTNTNAVTFAVTPSMAYLADNTAATSDTYSKTIGWKSGAYHPYDTLTSPVIAIPSGLKYATIFLKNLQLDENARLYVYFYTAGGTNVSTVTVNGPINDSSRGIQVPNNLLASIASAKVVIKTAGQVNTTLNGGVEVDRVEGVYKTNATAKATYVTIPGAKINWTAADVVYSETKTMTNAQAADYGIVVANAVKYVYQVPVFPFTGDAIVTVYNSNNAVLAYYLIPTVNATDNDGDNLNANVLVDSDSAQAILASKNEVTDKVGTIAANTDGTTVTVNSEKVGSTLLKGVISIPGVSKDVLDATNATVYTSVNWAPLPKAGTVTAANANLFALQGQKVTVVAQLVDQNGNPATEQGQTVRLEPFATAPVAGVGISSNGIATTDTNGQAKWTLSASSLAYVKDLKATNTNYNVKLTVGSTDVSVADLYWISAQLTHKPTLDSTSYTTATLPADYKAQYAVGKSVEFGFQANGIVGNNLPVIGVTLANIPVDFSKVTGTVGSASSVSGKPYIFLAQSDRAGLELVDAKIGTITNQVTVQYTTDGTHYFDGTFVGTGSSTIYDKFRMPISWSSQGEQFSFVVPTGNVAATGTDAKAFIKLTDSLGNALANKNIAVSIDNVAINGGVTTDANGIATVTVPDKAAGQQSTIKAEYNGDTQYYSINWVAARPFAIVSAGVNTSGTNDVVTVTLSNSINPASVVARQFTISTTNGVTTTVYAVKSVEVDGNQVKLTLADSNAHLYNKEATTYTVQYDPYTEFAGDNAGIQYNLVDVDGNMLASSNITFVTPANVSVKTVTIAGNTLHVEFYNAGTLTAFVVDSNGVVTSQALVNGAADITVDGTAQSFTVYVNGVSYTLFN